VGALWGRYAEVRSWERTIALGNRLAAELFDHRARTVYSGDDERVFCSPTKGTPFDVARYSATLKAALAKAGITRPMRPFHDGRHTSITSSAAAGLSPAALMSRAGHSDFKTTQGSISTWRGSGSEKKLHWWSSVCSAQKLVPKLVPT
jgi:integrase